MTVPIIKLEVQHMQHSVMKALTEYAAQMDQDIQEAVQAVCTPENVRKIVMEEARRSLESAIAEEMKNFYYRGDGRRYVRQAVEKLLANDVL